MSSSRRSSGGGGGGSKSRSPSPNPSAASSPFRTRRSIAGTTLSKESLYAPLTTYLPKKQAAAGSATTSSDKNDGDGGRKSPGGIKFQSIPRELREAALVDHLSTISSAYHHPTLSASLASGNRESMGMGRNNGGRSLPRRSYEDRLLQRSLVLVGGGLMTSSVAGSVAADNNTEPSASASRHAVDVSRAQRRKRRRERGHRVRGSISNAERKRREEAKAKEAERSATDVGTKAGGGSFPNNNKKRKRVNATYAHDTLLKLNDMWNGYISKLLRMGQKSDNDTTTRLPAEAGSGRQRRPNAELSALLSSAELIGAFVKIDRCDASRTYVGREGIVVDSTANAWRIALLRPVVEKKAKKRKEKSVADDKEEKTDDAPNKSNEEEDDATTVSVVWKEVVVPKTRSTLSFAIDAGRNNDVPGNFLRIVIGQV